MMKVLRELLAHGPATTRPAMSSDFAGEVIAGLSSTSRRIDRRWLYDERGRDLLDAMLRSPDNYPVQAERWLLQSRADEIAALAGPGASIVDVSVLANWPFVRDMGRQDSRSGFPGRLLVFVPCSVVAQVAPGELTPWLRDIGQAAGRNAVLVVGSDTTCDPTLLMAPGRDRAGAHAAFHLNLLRRINRELGGDFDLGNFSTVARHDARQRHLEMHLVSRCAQQVQVRGHRFEFAEGATIHVADQHQFGVLQFRTLANCAGWLQRQLWMDAASRVAVHVFEPAAAYCPGQHA